jgi:hypothetical protein
MGTLHTITAPPPSLYVAGDRPPVANAYFAVAIEAAVDLLEAREYRDLPRPERLAKAQAEQRSFLTEFLDPGLGMALDLRVTADPGATNPVSAALLGRVWGGTVDGVTERAEGLRARVRAAVPRHVIASPVDDADAVARLLSPFPGASVDSAVITRHEVISPPTRPDAGVSYYYTAAPFTLSDNDWSGVYSVLAASRVPVVLSVAVLPMTVPPQFAQTLLTLANYYGRLAREGEHEAGPYGGRTRLAPDAFAVDAEKTFHDFARRLSQKAFALRIQVSAPRQLPPGIVEAVAEAISPAERAGGFAEPQRAACEVRRPGSVAERRLAEYNLNVVNLAMLTGRQEIWGRQDPPDPQLAMLSVLGDARDAGCAFRFPIAVDGVVPGFPVRHGLFGPGTAYQLTGPAIRLGQVSRGSRDVAVPLRALARPALVVGAAGSGKTATAAEILRQLWTDHGIPFLVIEPGNADAAEYRKLAAAPGLAALEVITVGDEAAAPLRFNPFAVPPGTGISEHVTSLLGCFTAAFGLSGPLPSIYLDALNLTYLRAGFLGTERPAGGDRAWPTIVDFLAAMTEVTGDLGYAGETQASLDAATVRRVRPLVRGIAGSALLTDQPTDVGRLLDHPVLLELGSLGAEDEQVLLTALLLNAVIAHGRSVRGPSPGLAHVTLIEEAHRLLARAAGGRPPAAALARERAAAALTNALAESRGHGEGVILAGRFPARLLADAVTGSNLKLVHRLTADEDQRSLTEAMGADDAPRPSAARLRPGEALLHSDESAEIVPVSIARAVADAIPSDLAPAAAAPPFAACAPCRAQCAYRGAALSMLNDPAIVTGITAAAAEPPRSGLAGPDERERAGLAELRRRLQETVERFPALPATDPGRQDAAFCLFLHVYATSEMRHRPAWPAIAARLLGIAGEQTNPDAAPQD